MYNTREVIIYMHGITPDPTPDIHKCEYDSFEKLLKEHLGPNRYPEVRVDLEWGFDPHRADATETMDRILAPAEQTIFQEVDEIANEKRDITLNPLRFLHTRLRKNFITGLTDMFYYVSEDGKEQVRLNAFRTLLDRLPQLSENEKYSFTIISHSAGAVIMHDLLFILFGGSSKSFLSKESDVTRLDTLKKHAKEDRLFIRCFVTMGAPIAPMVVRSKTLLNMLCNDNMFNGKLDLTAIGIRKKDNSRWLNFWDKDDVFSCPIKFLYDDPDNLLEDCYVDIGDFFPAVHGKYWTSDSVAKVVAGNIEGRISP